MEVGIGEKKSNDMNRILRKIVLLLVYYFSLDIIPFIYSLITDTLITSRIGIYDSHGFWGYFNGIFSHFIAGITCVVATQKILPSRNKWMLSFLLLFGLILIIFYKVTSIEKTVPEIISFHHLASWYVGLLPAIWMIINRNSED